MGGVGPRVWGGGEHSSSAAASSWVTLPPARCWERNPGFMARVSGERHRVAGWFWGVNHPVVLPPPQREA